MKSAIAFLFLFLASFLPAQGNGLYPGGPLNPFSVCGGNNFLNPAIFAFQTPPGISPLVFIPWTRSLSSPVQPQIPCGIYSNAVVLPLSLTNTSDQLSTVVEIFTLLGSHSGVEWTAQIQMPPGMQGLNVYSQWWHFWDEPGFGTRLTGTQRYSHVLQ